jgi:hypothetical protein
MNLIKTITIDNFFTKEQAQNLCSSVYNLNYVENDLGKEIQNFNLVPPDSDELFSKVLNMNLKVDQDNSGSFRLPKGFIHFEGFESDNEWIFAVALQECTFNLFEHKSGINNATEEYRLNYLNLFDWDLMVNYVLKPGQGIMFRPWLFHSFDSGLIQLFRLTENEKL